MVKQRESSNTRLHLATPAYKTAHTGNGVSNPTIYRPARLTPAQQGLEDKSALLDHGCDLTPHVHR
jgi:hypothetical protein